MRSCIDRRPGQDADILPEQANRRRANAVTDCDGRCDEMVSGSRRPVRSSRPRVAARRRRATAWRWRGRIRRCGSAPPGPRQNAPLPPRHRSTRIRQRRQTDTPAPDSLRRCRRCGPRPRPRADSPAPPASVHDPERAPETSLTCVVMAQVNLRPRCCGHCDNGTLACSIGAPRAHLEERLMRTTTARTMRCRDRRTYSPVAPAPDLHSARASGIGRAPPALTSGGLAGWLVTRPVRSGSSASRRRIRGWCLGTPADAWRSRFFLIYQYTKV